MEGDHSIAKTIEDCSAYPSLPVNSLSNDIEYVKMQDEDYCTPPPMVSSEVSTKSGKMSQIV